VNFFVGSCQSINKTHMPFDKRPIPPPLPTSNTGPRIRSCFNCGGTDGHQLQDCPEPQDRERIRVAREAAQKQREEDLLNNAGQPGQGKGHKQRGGGAIVTSKVPGGVLIKQGVEMKEWMKTPQDCLIEYCKSVDRPKPRFDKLPKDEKGHRFRLVLQDAKKPGTDKDLIFMPSRGFEDEIEAKHTLALLALKELNPSLPLERKLPDPYREFWLALIGGGSGGGGKGSSSGNTTTEKGKKGSGASSTIDKASIFSATGGVSSAPSTIPLVSMPSLSTLSTPSTPLSLPTWDDNVSTTATISSTTSIPTSSIITPTSLSSNIHSTQASKTQTQSISSTKSNIESSQTQHSQQLNKSDDIKGWKQPQQTQLQQKSEEGKSVKKFTPPGPISAAAMATATSASSPQAVQLKKTISLDIGLASKGSVAEKKRLEQEKERKKSESKNKRAVKMRELLARNADSFVLMSTANRKYVEGVLKEATEEGRGKKKMSTNKQFSSSTRGEEELDDVTSLTTSSSSSSFTSSSDPSYELELEAEADAERADLEAYVKRLSLPIKTQTIIETRLEKLGFTKTQVIEAVKEGSVSASLDAIAIAKTSGYSIFDLLQRKTLLMSLDPFEVESASLDWLCLNVPEDKLPPAFDPRGKALEIRNLTASSLVSSLDQSDKANNNNNNNQQQQSW
jgi:hypothetical protein